MKVYELIRGNDCITYLVLFNSNIAKKTQLTVRKKFSDTSQNKTITSLNVGKFTSDFIEFLRFII